MSFLGLGKKKDKKELPPLKFPDIQIPKYEQFIPPIRKEPSFPIPEIPKRKPFVNKEPIIIHEPTPITPLASTPTPTSKNIFVKIEKYKTATKLMKEIKTKLEETKRIMDKLNEIKSQEDQEIQTWENNLLEIKEKLESIDKSLFS